MKGDDTSESPKKNNLTASGTCNTFTHSDLSWTFSVNLTDLWDEDDSTVDLETADTDEVVCPKFDRSCDSGDTLEDSETVFDLVILAIDSWVVEEVEICGGNGSLGPFVEEPESSLEASGPIGFGDFLPDSDILSFLILVDLGGGVGFSSSDMESSSFGYKPFSDTCKTLKQHSFITITVINVIILPTP